MGLPDYNRVKIHHPLKFYVAGFRLKSLPDLYLNPLCGAWEYSRHSGTFLPKKSEI